MYNGLSSQLQASDQIDPYLLGPEERLCGQSAKGAIESMAWGTDGGRQVSKGGQKICLQSYVEAVWRQPDVSEKYIASTASVEV
jgi:hypothetical protein